MSMAHRTATIAFRRKRQGRTDYRRRLKMLSGQSVRLVVRRSLQHTYAQLVRYRDAGDHVLASASTAELGKRYGWKLNGGNCMSGYLVGVLIAQKAKACKVAEAVLDIGQIASTKGSRVYAVLKGALAGGLLVPHSADILPSDDRIMGKHVAYAGTAKGFSRYRTAGVDPTSIATLIAETKQKIMKG